jgi:hypothetical protein
MNHRPSTDSWPVVQSFRSHPVGVGVGVGVGTGPQPVTQNTLCLTSAPCEPSAPGVVVIPDGHGVSQQNLRVGIAQRRRPLLERHSRVRVPLVVAVEVHLEGAAHTRLIVRRVIERPVIDLDRPVVARWGTRRGRRASRAEGGPRPPGSTTARRHRVPATFVACLTNRQRARCSLQALAGFSTAH